MTVTQMVTEGLTVMSPPMRRRPSSPAARPMPEAKESSQFDSFGTDDPAEEAGMVFSAGRARARRKYRGRAPIAAMSLVARARHL